MARRSDRTPARQVFAAEFVKVGENSPSPDFDFAVKPVMLSIRASAFRQPRTEFIRDDLSAAFRAK